jgi:hypothetical protein
MNRISSFLTKLFSGRYATRANIRERNLGAYLQTDIWLLVDLTVSKIRWFTTDKSEYTAYNMKIN